MPEEDKVDVEKMEGGDLPEEGNVSKFLDEIHFEDEEKPVGDKEEDEEKPVGDKEEDNETDKGKKSADGKDKKPESSETEKLQTEIERLREDKKNLQKALHDKRFERKEAKTKDETPVLTDDQLVAILEEHKDDPRVLLNAIKYQAEQIAKGVKKSVMDESEVKAKQKDIDHFLKSRYPDLDKEDSEMRDTVDKTKEMLGLNENPFGDYLATGVQVLNNLESIVQHWYEEGKKAAGSEQMDTARKKQIKDGQLTPGGKGPGKGNGEDGLSLSQFETAKKLGFKTPAQLKLYRDQILATKRTRSQERED